MSDATEQVALLAAIAEVGRLRNEIARLNNQTNWVCSCGGTDTKGQRENEEQARLLGKGAEREARLLGRIGELQGTLDAVTAANERAAKRWQAAHPGKELVIPDQATMVEWLLEQLAKFDDPHRLHAHCVRHLSDLQVSHLFGERMTVVANDRDRLQAENAALRKDKERLDWLHCTAEGLDWQLRNSKRITRDSIDDAMGEGKQ